MFFFQCISVLFMCTSFDNLEIFGLCNNKPIRKQVKNEKDHRSYIIKHHGPLKNTLKNK